MFLTEIEKDQAENDSMEEAACDRALIIVV
jgi:hypothetical protein